MTHIISILVILSLVGCSFASEKRICTEKEAKQALIEASTLHDWDSLCASFRQYAQCDDAAISEGYSDSVCRLLAFDWKQFGKLHKLVKSNKKFEQFVLKHIDGTVPANELKIILENARTHCPQGNEGLCKSIEGAAKKVLEGTK